MKNTQAWIWGAAVAGAVALSVGIMVSESGKREATRASLQETSEGIAASTQAWEEYLAEVDERKSKVDAGEPVLLSCRACEAPVSSQAAACPGCGQPTSRR
jgi:rubrerythrin